MKTSFFTAVILGFAAFHQQVEAVSLESHDFDFADFGLAEINGEGKGESLADADADADCEETVGGVTMRLKTPECEKPKPQIPFDAQMLLALQELSGKSMTLYDALKAQFGKSAEL